MNEPNWQARAEAAEAELERVRVSKQVAEERLGHERVCRLELEAELERVRTLNHELLTRSSSDATSRALFAERELERVRKACAEMRRCIVTLLSKIDLDALNHLHPRLYAYTRDLLEKDDAGSDYHHRDEFKPLVEALDQIAAHTNPDDENSYRADDREGCLDTVYALGAKALSDARAKGLIP